MAIDYSILGMPFQRQAQRPTYSQSVQQGLGTYKDLSNLYHEGQKRQKLSALGQTLKGEFAKPEPNRNVMLGALAEYDPQGALGMYNAWQKGQGNIEKLAQISEALKAKELDILAKLKANPKDPLWKDKVEYIGLVNEYNSLAPKNYKSALYERFKEEDRMRKAEASEKSLKLRERGTNLAEEKFVYGKARDEKEDEMEERKFDLSEKKFAQSVKQFEVGQQSKAEAMATTKANLNTAYDDLTKDPNDLGARAKALLLILRDESGAAIAQDEFLGRASSFLSGANYEAMQNDVLGFTNWAIGVFRNDEILQYRILRKYLPEMSALGMRRELLNMIGESRDILKERSKKIDKELGITPQPSNNDNDLLNELEGLQ